MSLPYKKIMVTLDGSDLAKDALPYAQEMAEQSQAELTLFRVVPLITRVMYVNKHTFHDPQQMEAEQLGKVDEAMDSLQALAETLRLHHIQARAAVDVGDPAEKIVDFAKANQIDLIVMSTHGRTGVRKLVAGSVASKVSSSAPCPVLLVRSSG